MSKRRLIEDSLELLEEVMEKHLSDDVYMLVTEDVKEPIISLNLMNSTESNSVSLCVYKPTAEDVKRGVAKIEARFGVTEQPKKRGRKKKVKEDK